ncbi:hypothetical protein OF83DRAFT_838825 [Amylostereum chailletii]|nr:hypothetical protein OF83DRAFT_838825 [Amylostereum chailletii]
MSFALSILTPLLAFLNFFLSFFDAFAAALSSVSVPQTTEQPELVLVHELKQTAPSRPRVPIVHCAHHKRMANAKTTARRKLIRDLARKRAPIPGLMAFLYALPNDVECHPTPPLSPTLSESSQGSLPATPYMPTRVLPVCEDELPITGTRALLMATFNEDFKGKGFSLDQNGQLVFEQPDVDETIRDSEYFCPDLPAGCDDYLHVVATLRSRRSSPPPSPAFSEFSVNSFQSSDYSTLATPPHPSTPLSPPPTPTKSVSHNAGLTIKSSPTLSRFKARATAALRRSVLQSATYATYTTPCPPPAPHKPVCADEDERLARVHAEVTPESSPSSKARAKKIAEQRRSILTSFGRTYTTPSSPASSPRAAVVVDEEKHRSRFGWRGSLSRSKLTSGAELV